MAERDRKEAAGEEYNRQVKNAWNITIIEVNRVYKTNIEAVILRMEKLEWANLELIEDKNAVTRII